VEKLPPLTTPDIDTPLIGLGPTGVMTALPPELSVEIPETELENVIVLVGTVGTEVVSETPIGMGSPANAAVGSTA